ncbi:MAG: hypothetical protein ABSG13_26280 [Bryobacteraceae bacterium]|jgi:hypothetical protein
MRVAIFGLVGFATVLASAQELYLPQGPVTRLASPDASQILYSQKSNNGTQLWIEDKRTHRKTKLFDVGGTLSAAWSADGTAFYVNDHWASDRERAYICDAATLQLLDIADRILAEDPETRPFAAGHTYFAIERWDGTQDVAVRFSGHTDEPPVVQFDFRYRVSRTGVVKKLSQRTAPVKN